MMKLDSMELSAVETKPLSQAALDYARVERALRFLNANYALRPTLAQIAAHVHTSPFHFERLFQRWAGISPKRFLQYLTKEHAKALLQESKSILETTYAAGLSSTGRLHDLFVTCEAVTPGETKAHGKGLTIHYGFHATPFGRCLLAKTSRGICALRFVEEPSGRTALRDLQAEWPAAVFGEEPRETEPLVLRIFSSRDQTTGPLLPLHIRGTNFQLNVWQALLLIPSGQLADYSTVAAAIGAKRSQRAVGSAIGRNPVAFLIPCHRVIRNLGVIGDYRWGHERKQAIIAWESAHRNASPS